MASRLRRTSRHAFTHSSVRRAWSQKPTAPAATRASAPLVTNGTRRRSMKGRVASHQTPRPTPTPTIAKAARPPRSNSTSAADGLP